VTVNLTRVATPANAAQDLVGLGVVLGLLEKISPVWPHLVVMASNSLFNPRHVISRNVKPPEHALFALLHQNTPVTVPSEEIDQRRRLVREAALQLGVRVRLAALEIDGTGLQPLVGVLLAALSSMMRRCQHSSEVGCRLC
jgi:hypothetical protein